MTYEVPYTILYMRYLILRGMKQEVKDMQEKYRTFTVKLHDYSNEELTSW